MKINRALVDIIKQEMTGIRKIVVVFGARQTGKSTLLQDILGNTNEKVLDINADEIRYVDILSS